MTATPKIDKAALAERLTRLSDELHEASADMRTMGYPGHADGLGSMASHASIYAHQVRSLVRMDAKLKVAA